MRKIIVSLLFLTLTVLFTISGCGIMPDVQNTIMPTTLSPTITIAPTATPIPSPTSGTPQVPALVKTSIEFYRNGKTYEIVVGYDIGEAFFVATPRPEMPEKWDDAAANSADLKWYGDLDVDGELEFMVSLLYCGAYCSEAIQVYEYDPIADNYFVADEFGAKAPAVEKYEDIDVDGNPELITEFWGFCYLCSTASRVYSAVSVIRYEEGKFKDVTREFPELLEDDAENFLEALEASTDLVAKTSLLASYIYDMYRLGKWEEARPVFDRVCDDGVASKPTARDCDAIWLDIESSIKEFENNTN